MTNKATRNIVGTAKSSSNTLPQNEETEEDTRLVSRIIRVFGIVQGVGFRPFIWRLANELELNGSVHNDGQGVQIFVQGRQGQVCEFERRIGSCAPPLSRIDEITSRSVAIQDLANTFLIADSAIGSVKTNVAPDAATCAACANDILDPDNRRYRYPFTNCTHCGPRFSIVTGVPYDRAQTTMSGFEMCAVCTTEYESATDRRFHAQPIACPDCGPKVWREHFGDGTALHDECDDPISLAAKLFLTGQIGAIKGLGGFHLACDATNAEAVAALRKRKQRDRKPFAMMARDLDAIRAYCTVSETEMELLQSAEAPVVLLARDGQKNVADDVAPGVNTLGFMLPYTPLHALIFENLDRPLVMTSGNLSEEPQVIANEDARAKLAMIADFGVFHDRDIANRVDDSVVRVIDHHPRLLRRARGYAPVGFLLPQGFDDAPKTLAFGGELKATFCIVRDGMAFLSQHQGDLENADTFDDYKKNIGLYADLYDHRPDVLVADKHPEYLSTKLAKEQGETPERPLVLVQHHHAHIASCLADNGVAIDAPPVVGVALDGVGYGDDGTIWGGEFLFADYRGFERLATFKPVAMTGGAQAVREPWRNLYAHICAGMGWEQFHSIYATLEITKFLREKPREILDQMILKSVNAPLASSCGRLFDAVAAALGLCRERATYEGEGAILIEALACEKTLRREDNRAYYPFAIQNQTECRLPIIEPEPMWNALFDDLATKTPTQVIAAKFHNGLSKAVSDMVLHVRDQLRDNNECDTDPMVVLSGGCFQNKVLLEKAKTNLERNGLKVLAHINVPANDGGLALGQAAVAAARMKKS